MKTIICKECGKSVEAATLSTKYCPECRIAVFKAQTRAASKRRRSSVRIAMSADTDEMMMMCLNCTRPRCGGECKELAALAKRYSDDNTGKDSAV